MVVPAHDEADDEEEWQWVQEPSHHHHHHHQESPAAAAAAAAAAFPLLEDNEEEETSASPPAGLFTLDTTRAESLSSTASSPVQKSFFVTVMAKEHNAAVDALQHSVSEWIEPQLVFSEPHGIQLQGFEMYNVVKILQNLPKAKEALESLLSDPVVWDALMNNKSLQELTYQHTDIDHRSEVMKSNTVYKSSMFYNGGKQAYRLLRGKLSMAIDILFSLLDRHSFEKSDVDQLDTTVKSCILLVAILLFLIIGKRSSKGEHLCDNSV